jgi:hypothetical protein
MIEKALQNLDVKYLDLNKVDLCSETIYKAAPNAKDLCLYSSGNNAVHRGWAQQGGLVRNTVAISSFVEECHRCMYIF